MRESTQVFNGGSMQGTKHDQNKPRMSLVPAGVLAEVIAVLEHGAAKYGENNWTQVEGIRYFDAAHRHLGAWWTGEEVDKESGQAHLAHAICCLMFLMRI